MRTAAARWTSSKKSGDPMEPKTMRRILADIMAGRWTWHIPGTGKQASIDTDAGNITVDVLARLADERLDQVVAERRLVDAQKPELPPNRVETLNMLCMVLGHRRSWEPAHPGSSWEVERCTRCGDTSGGSRRRT